MLLRPSFVSRRLRRPWSLLRFCCGIALLILLVDTFILISQLPPSPSNLDRRRRMRRNPSSRNQSIFIASVHQNSAPRLHATWSDAVIQLVGHLGPENVYFSAVTHSSSDGTVPELVQLERRLRLLQVGHTIRSGRKAWDLEEEANGEPPGSGEGSHTGWIWYPKHQRWTLRRAPVDAKAKNMALAPFYELLEQGRTFDRILWLDDNIVFDPQAAASLLEARGGDYAAVCSAAQPGRYTNRLNELTLRDDRGHRPVSTRWPWMSSPTSRAAAWAGSPIPVRSCWGGIVAFDAQPFYETHSRLEFRSVSDEVAGLQLDASERCLIHTDNPLAASKGIWVEPSVQTGLDCKEGCWKPAKRLSSSSWASAVWGVWGTRLGAWGNSGGTAARNPEFPQVLDWALHDDPRMDERALPCLMDEVQIIKRTKWTFQFSKTK